MAYLLARPQNDTKTGPSEIHLLTEMSYTTDNTMDISLIRSDDYDPFNFCQFQTVGGEVALVSGIAQKTRDFWPINEVSVGPPRPILSVSCSGVCVAINGKLEEPRGISRWSESCH